MFKTIREMQSEIDIEAERHENLWRAFIEAQDLSARSAAHSAIITHLNHINYLGMQLDGLKTLAQLGASVSA